jgi:hypothetical protein
MRNNLESLKLYVFIICFYRKLLVHVCSIYSERMIHTGGWRLNVLDNTDPLEPGEMRVWNLHIKHYL